MARVPGESRFLFGLATAEVLGDDEIAIHAEAIEDGRDAPELRLWPPSEFQDDEIASHLEEQELIFAPLAAGEAPGRRATRH